MKTLTLLMGSILALATATASGASIRQFTQQFDTTWHYPVQNLARIDRVNTIDSLVVINRWHDAAKSLPAQVISQFLNTFPNNATPVAYFEPRPPTPSYLRYIPQVAVIARTFDREIPIISPDLRDPHHRDFG